MATYKVTLINDSGLKQTIEVEDEQYIFDAAEDEGIELPISCRSGSCSSCAGKIISGQIDQSEQAFLDEEQIDAGFILTCVAIPLSDCTIQTHQEEFLY